MDIFHAVVGGGVHFQHVGGRAALNGQAGGAFSAGIAVLRIFAVDGARQNLGAGGFARSAGTAKKIGVAGGSGGHLVPEHRGNVFLSAHIVKGMRPPFPIKRLMHENRLSARARRGT